MDIWHLFNKLCLPAQVYLVISLFSLFLLFYQNMAKPYEYCIGLFKAHSNCNNKVFFMFKLIYIAIWVFILQKLCSKGYSTISWIIVLLPILGMFILTGLLMLFLLKNTKVVETKVVETKIVHVNHI
jgi:uncharacterized membrane protein YiaA